MKPENLGRLIIGQEVICSHGLGRVSEVTDSFPNQTVQVNTYVGNRGCHWGCSSVKAFDYLTGEEL